MVKPQSIAELLANHPVLAGIDPEIAALLSGCARNVAIADGALLAREGETTHAFHLVRAGRVALETVVPGRGRTILQTVGPGGFVGEHWLVPPYTAEFDARAMGTVRAVSFDADCLLGKCEADPAIGYVLLKRFVPLLLERLRAARMKALDLYAAPVPAGEA